MPAGTSYWVKQGMLQQDLYAVDVDGDGIRDHVYFTVRNQFLHPNHPLGWVRHIGVTLDSISVPDENIFFVLRGQWVPLSLMPQIRDIWWHMMEEARLYLRMPSPGAGRHRLGCSLEISLHVHTENVDTEDIWPRLVCRLENEMELKEEESP